MKILKLLNKKYLSIICFLLLGLSSYAEDNPVDIWNTNKEKIKDSSQTDLQVNEVENNTPKKVKTSIYSMQSKKEENINLEQAIELIIAKAAKPPRFKKKTTKKTTKKK